MLHDTPAASFIISVDIVMGNVPEVMALIKFLRDKFDIEFLYNKLLNESGEADNETEEITEREVVRERVLIIENEEGVNYDIVPEPETAGNPETMFGSRRSFSKRSSFSGQSELPAALNALQTVRDELKKGSPEAQKESPKSLSPQDSRGGEESAINVRDGIQKLEARVSTEGSPFLERSPSAKSRRTSANVSPAQASSPTKVEPLRTTIPLKVENRIDTRSPEQVRSTLKPRPASTAVHPVSTSSTHAPTSVTPPTSSSPAPINVEESKTISVMRPDGSFIRVKTESVLTPEGNLKTQTGETIRPRVMSMTKTVTKSAKPTPESTPDTSPKVERKEFKPITTTIPPASANPSPASADSAQPADGRKQSFTKDPVPLRESRDDNKQAAPATTTQPPATQPPPKESPKLERKEIRRESKEDRAPEQFPEPVDPRVVKAQNGVRRKIADEILTTERNYVLHLQVLTQYFLRPVEGLNILTSGELYKLSANLADIIAFHKTFLDQLQDRIGKWNDASILSDIFLANSDFFKNYLPYIANFGESLLTFCLLANKYKELGPIVKAFDDFQAKSSRLSLESLMVMPVQRLPRYILLLKEMKKYTGKVNPKEEEKLGLALEKIQVAMTEINQKSPKGNLDSVKLLQMILESVEGELHVRPSLLFPQNNPQASTYSSPLYLDVNQHQVSVHKRRVLEGEKVQTSG